MKNNKRELTNQKMIQAFLDSLNDHSIEKISVTEICEKIQINRSTFYDHYESVYQLSEAAFNYLNARMIQSATKDIPSLGAENIAEKITTRTLVEIKKNKNTLLQFVNYRGNIVDFNDSKIIQQFLSERSLSNNEIQKFDISFFESGVNGIVYKWVKNNCKESEQDVSKAIVSIMHRIFDEHWYEKGK